MTKEQRTTKLEEYTALYFKAYPPGSTGCDIAHNKKFVDLVAKANEDAKAATIPPHQCRCTKRRLWSGRYGQMMTVEWRH